MSETVLVRSSMRTWDLVLWLLTGVVLFAVGWIVFEAGNKELGIGMQVGGGIIALGSAMATQWRIRRRLWARCGAETFTLFNRQQETEYQDARVRSLALRFRPFYSNGIKTFEKRTILIWIAQDDRSDAYLVPLRLETIIKIGASDPLAGLIARLTQQVHLQARQLIAAGQQFAGDGWSCDGVHVIIPAVPEPRLLAFDDVEATGIVDNKLCLWRQGQDEAELRINIDSINAYVLKWLIDEHLAMRSRPADTSPNPARLGRLLFQRKISSTTSFLLTVFAITCAIFATVVLFEARQARMGADVVETIVIYCGAVVLLAAAAGFVLGVVYCRIAAFRCRQFGLEKRGLFTRQSLRYEHVESFKYEATTLRHKGVYTGTLVELDFLPDVEHRSQRIRYSVTLKHTDDELENLRDQVANLIGGRMRREIDSGNRVHWTSNLTFHVGNLIYTAAGFIRRKDPVVIAIADIEGYKLASGECQLFARGQTKPVVQEKTQAQNFFAGLSCLLGLMKSEVRTIPASITTGDTAG